MANNHDVDDLLDPPDAPEIEPRLSLEPSQWVLFPLILALPVLAIIGVFGERRDTRHVQAGPIEVTVQYPTVLRYKLRGSIDIQVHNRGPATIDTVTVALDTTYLQRWADLSAVPPFDNAFELSIPHVGAGEDRLARIELVANRHGRHRGSLIVTTRGTDTARIVLTTRIFP